MSSGQLKILLLASLVLFCAFSFAGGFILGQSSHYYTPSFWKGYIPQSESNCTTPSIRREWRSLGQSEKYDYIDAVQCLRSQPSRVRSEGVLYDDFPFIHNQVGGYSHGAAPFLSWHRYFLHVFESTLRSQCGYNGTLVYWDWSLDWEDLANSPVFDSETGFGGDGNKTGEITVGEGRCVVDGPFADLDLPFFNGDDHNHCLSRGFFGGDSLGLLPGAEVRPEAIENVLRQPDYQSFFLALEHGPHNEIPNGIRGDFIKFTAPNDPIFFLHHTQLDRIWWRWQQIKPQKRLLEYTGIARHGSKDAASLDDILSMGGFTKDVRVSDIMATELGLLCYRY